MQTKCATTRAPRATNQRLSTRAAETTQPAKPKTKKHPLHLRARNRPGVVIVVPRDDVSHCPSVAPDAVVYVCDAVCCRSGAACLDAHVDLARAVEHVFHERNAAWATTDDVPYARFPAGDMMPVAAPNANESLELLNPQLVLKTRALEAERRPLSRCAHFERKGYCTLGAACEFVHVLRDVSMASRAVLSRTVQRSQELAGYELLPTFASSDAEVDSDENDQSTAMPSLSVSRSSRYRHDPYRASTSSPLASPLNPLPPASAKAPAPVFGAIDNSADELDMPITENTFSSASTSRTSAPRRRHNPYSLTCSVMWC